MQSSIVPLNHRFSRITASGAPIVPVITPEGNIKWLKVRPDVEPKGWLVIEWEEADGRRIGAKSARLTQERLTAGAMLLEDAYRAEGFEAGWKAYQRYLNEVFTREGLDRDGKPTTFLLRRPKNINFPDSMLPRVVRERQGLATKRREATTFDVGDIKRPDPQRPQQQATPASMAQALAIRSE